jgi:hypothetical protein
MKIHANKCSSAEVATSSDVTRTGISYLVVNYDVNRASYCHRAALCVAESGMQHACLSGVQPHPNWRCGMKRGLVLAAPVLLFSATGIPAAHSRPLTMSQASLQQQAAQTFTGTIVKSGDAFKLEVTATKTTYMLDDTQRASKFDGKKVKVTGTLDANTQMIRVESIQITS